MVEALQHYIRDALVYIHSACFEVLLDFVLSDATLSDLRELCTCKWPSVYGNGGCPDVLLEIYCDRRCCSKVVCMCV